MKIILDGKELPFRADFAGKIEDLLKKDNRVVKKIMVNDVEMVNAGLQEIFAGPESGKKVNIETTSVDELIRETLKDGVAYIPRLQKGLLSIRDRILSGETGEAKKMLDACLEGLEWLLLTLEAAAVSEHYAQIKTVLAVEKEKLNSSFPELETAMRDDDLILVADILEYEIVPFLENILPVIDEINKN